MTGENGNGELLIVEMNPDGSVKRAIFEGDYLYPLARAVPDLSQSQERLDSTGFVKETFAVR
jgi:hypothetical protein